jgi:hypothetical protein
MGVIVDTGFQCVTRRGMFGGMISYRHDTGAWLNADRTARGWPRQRAHRARRGDDAVRALEDLWI